MGEIDPQKHVGGDVLVGPPQDPVLFGQWFDLGSRSEVMAWMISRPQDDAPIQFDTSATKSLEKTARTFRNFILGESQRRLGEYNCETPPSQSDIMIVLDPTDSAVNRPTLVISKKFGESARLVKLRESGVVEPESPRNLRHARYELPAGYRATMFSTQRMLYSTARRMSISTQTDKAVRLPLQTLYERVSTNLADFDKDIKTKQAAGPLGRMANNVFGWVSGRSEGTAA